MEPVLKGGRAEAVCGVGLPKTFRGRFHAPLRLDAGFVGIVNDIVVLEGPALMSRPTNKGGRPVLVTGGRLVIVVLRGRVDNPSTCVALSLRSDAALGLDHSSSVEVLTQSMKLFWDVVSSVDRKFQNVRCSRLQLGRCMQDAPVKI